MNKKILQYLDTKKNSQIIFAVFRTDRIGDTVFSLQIAELLKDKYKNSKVIFIINSYTKPLFENNPFVDEVLSVNDYKRDEFIRLLKSKKIDISISLIAKKESSIIPFLSKIPIRIGPLTKIYSIFFNVRILQNRSKSIKHEAIYNIELLDCLGIFKTFYPEIYLTDKEKNFGRDYFSNLGYENNDKIVMLHPGSGGSSKDWPLEKYFNLAELLIGKNVGVLISGSKNELIKYQSYVKKYNFDDNVLMKEELNLRDFFSVISNASIFVSNSTGPLHCASALAIKTIGFFPPIKTCSSTRWGQFSHDRISNISITPLITSKDCYAGCVNCSCVSKISEFYVLERVFYILNNMF